MNSTNNLQVVSVTLRPYRNGTDFFTDLEILALAPGKKLADAYTSMSSAGAVWLSGLYHSQSVYLSPDAYAKLVDSAAIIELQDYMRYGGNEPATSEADVAQARAECKRLVDIAHERMAEAHPNYKPVFNDVVYLSPEEAANYRHPMRLPKPDESQISCFEDWMSALDYRLVSKFGVVSSDLEDRGWHDMYDDGYTPREAIAEYIEESGCE